MKNLLKILKRKLLKKFNRFIFSIVIFLFFLFNLFRISQKFEFQKKKKKYYNLKIVLF